MRLLINQGRSGAQVVGEMPTKHLPRDHFTSDSYIQRLSFPAGYSGFTYFTHLHKANDHLVSMKRSIT